MHARHSVKMTMLGAKRNSLASFSGHPSNSPISNIVGFHVPAVSGIASGLELSRFIQGVSIVAGASIKSDPIAIGPSDAVNAGVIRPTDL